MMSRIEELEKKIKELEKQTKELQHELELELEKQKTEIGYPFKNGDDYWSLDSFGNVRSISWTTHSFDKSKYSQGNVFKTQQEAQKEKDRRELLIRFKQYRDKCNGDWKPDFIKWHTNKYALSYCYKSGTFDLFNGGWDTYFQPFGYFKNLEDGLRAIELFGDEIKRLYVEE